MTTALLLLVAQLAQAGHYERGMELAQAQQWAEARQEFEAGAAENPEDKRFPIELAGVSYREGNIGIAQGHLFEALRLDPDDPYANDFLATLYYLERNYAAAVKYWNRVGAPELEFIETTPEPPVPRLLYDRAFDIAPGETLTLGKYRTTMAWIDSLDVLGSFNAEIDVLPVVPNAAALNVGPDQINDVSRYALGIRWSPPNKYSPLIRMGTGLFTQRLRYRWRNLDRKGMTVDAEYRWDAQKRRVFVEQSAPFLNQPSMRYRFYGDLRSETWDIGDPTDFRLRKFDIGGALRFIPTGRFWWEANMRVAAREFKAATFAGGFNISYGLGARYMLLDVPGRGLTVNLGASTDLGRFYSDQQGGLYSRNQLSLEGLWRPHPLTPDDPQYEYRATLRAGLIVGSAPFDELFMLARQRDDGIPLRGHSGTTNGKKGRAPVGKQFVLLNMDFFRETWRGQQGALDLGPLVDIGQMWRPVTGETHGKLQIDIGIQARLRLSSGFSFVVSYAHDLRGNAGRPDFSSDSLR